MSRILVIDDQASVRGLIRQTLERAGHAVVEAADGRQAAAALRSTFDLVITDVLMPEMDGLEVIQHIKGMGSDTPVLVVSAGLKHSSLDLLSFSQKLGADRTLSKGDIRTALLDTVADMLSMQGKRRAPK